MRLLLDTNTFLWAISDEPRLGPRSRNLITTEASSVLTAMCRSGRSPSSTP
jgi:PIN domain nuclease of toxin-antitoxin system